MSLGDAALRPAWAEPKASVAPETKDVLANDSLDVASYRAELIVLGDGKEHFVALLPGPLRGEVNSDHLVFYGDGKRFYAVTQQGYSQGGPDTWSYAFAEPRVASGGREEGSGYVGLREGKYTVTCGTRETVLQPQPAAATHEMLAAATFLRSPRKHRPYVLVRDDKGIYYYVDRGSRPETAKQFRLFSGAKGNLKPLKMTNVVSDSEGDVFTTRTGTLRLVLGRDAATWIEHSKERKLTRVPTDFNQNVAMIYNEFGVYVGERLGTPCDDL